MTVNLKINDDYRAGQFDTFDESELFEEHKFNWKDFLTDKYITNRSGQTHILIKGITVSDNFDLNAVHKINQQLHIIFSNCKFEGIVKLGQSDRFNILFTDGCIFSSSLTISYNNSSRPIAFKECYFKSSFEIILSDYTRFAQTIQNCTFGSIANFGEGTYQNHLLLNGSIFKKSLPNLRFCKNEKYVDLTNFKINENEIVSQFKKNYKNDEQNWIADIARDLKLKASDMNDHLREMDFFAIESKVRAIRDGGWAAALSSGYSLVSDFGRSISRPVKIWLVFILLMILINSSVTLTNKGNQKNYLDDVIVVSLKNAIPLSLGFNKETVTTANEIVYGSKVPPFWYQMMRLLFAGFNLIIWFMFFLAIRNRFKIG